MPIGGERHQHGLSRVGRGCHAQIVRYLGYVFYFLPAALILHRVHGQSSRSHTAGKRSRRPPAVSSRSAPVTPASRLPSYYPRKVGYTSLKMTILVTVASAQRAVIVGGGVLGTMHAVAARRRGFEVVQLEREAEARGASVRNFGLVWVSGRKAGPELALALRARELWAELGAEVPGLGFRAAGSLTLATEDAELAPAQRGGRAAGRGPARVRAA